MNSNTTERTQSSALETAERYVTAYNDGDLELLTSLISDDVRFWRHNNVLSLQGKDVAAGYFFEIKSAFPDRRLIDRRGIYAVGDQVIIEHTWMGTAAHELPGHAKKGVTVRLEAATFLRVRDGVITEYHDYA